MNPLRRTAGVALIVALLSVALATLSATALISAQQLAIRRTGNLLAQDQAWEYARGTEALVALQLQRDLQQGPLDHLAEDWAQGPKTLLIEGGEIRYYVQDLSGRFNLNSLVGPAGVDKLALARFQHLLELLELEPELVYALIDWIDPDQEPSFPAGAEDEWYQGLEPAYRSANQPLISITELRQVRGFEPEVMTRLQHYISALPQAAPINVNTASAVVLASLHPDWKLQEGAELAALRGEEGFSTLDAFGAAASALRAQPFSLTGLATSSQYFLLSTQVTLGPTRLQFESQLQRMPQGQVQVLARARGGL